MRKAILISGKQRSGKNDTAYLINRFMGFSFIPVSFAAPIKQKYAEKYRLSLDDVEMLKTKYKQVRDSLIHISEMAKKDNPFIWIDKALETQGDLIISDLRFKNELTRTKEKIPLCFTVRVDADRSIRATRGVLSNEDDPSETELDDEAFDFYVDNNMSMASLELQCANIALSIKETIYAHSNS